MSEPTHAAPAPKTWVTRSLDAIERIGNKLPDPAVLFLLLMFAVWALSAILANVSFTEIDPRSGNPVVVNSLLGGGSLTQFMADMVRTFTSFAPLGVVLVAMLGLGVAEHTGFINAALRAILAITPKQLLTPALIGVGVLSHVAVDAGYVLVIPLGAVIFYAAGRHPLAGIAAAFAGVSGGFSATMFVPSALDPLLAGLTQEAAQLINPAAEISPLNNYFFTTASTFLVIAVGWFLTDKVIEPRLKDTVVDGDVADMPTSNPLEAREKRGLITAVLAMGVAVLLFALSLIPETSPWGDPVGAEAANAHRLLTFTAPLMQSIVALIFVFFLIPGVVYGMVAGTVKTHRDVIEGMTKAMSGMGYYIVLAFFASQFIYAFAQSNLGVLLAIKGANALQAMGLHMSLTLVGIVLLSGFVNLMVGSASAKWALIGAIMVPMLMQLGISPDLTQAAYRVGDSSTNIITPLLPYFPLIVVFCQRYVKSSGIGTLIALMLPFSITLIVVWTLFLLGFWALGIPLGIGSTYTYPVG
jgi:aminobenzoyl-glutamate transport protein